MALGRKPGPEFGRILDRCYDAQLAGKFTTVEQGIRYAEELLRNPE
jgi:tRNA nucleotidyltransferase (CCA-adding enzyme)